MIVKRYRLLLCLGCFFAAGIGFRLIPTLFPVYEDQLKQNQFHSVKLFDRNGNLLQEVLSKDESRSIRIPIDNVSPYFLEAIIAVEDKNFYRHHGVDYTAVLRALVQNIRSADIVSGASTITLQLARMINPGRRTIIKKIREAFYGYRLEAGMGKKEILEAYINWLPMGGNLYGIESAARGYFGISAMDLTLAQATFLASIPNSPNRYNPYYHLEQIKKRQRVVLKRMVEHEYIAKNRLEGVLKEDVSLKPSTSSFLAPHFVFHLMNKLPDDVQEVKTTIDCEIQKMVQEQIDKVLFHLRRFHVTNGAALLVDNHSGEVLAYVGSANYFNVRDEGENDGVLALRQPGSTLKPFLYLLAMEKGYHPATVISDIPTHYRMPVGIYSPKNYSELFRGPVRLREALANSLNVPAVRVLADIGISTFLERLQEYEFYSLNRDADYYGVGLVLGSGEASLYELTRAYQCLARMGDFLPLKEILEINGRTQESMISKRSVSTAQLNYLVTDILNDRFARTAEFGFNSVLNLPFPCAVKTGTSFRFCDNWTIGYTADYTLGVWVGNFNHTPMQKISGISGAGPIFSQIMHHLYQKKSLPEKFPIPEGLTKVKVCPLSGKRPNNYCPRIIEEIIPETAYELFQHEECKLHIPQNGEIYTILPPEYKLWTEDLGVKTLSAHQDSTVFSIINPKDGAIYYRLSNLSPEYQSIQFKINCSDHIQDIGWFLNGESLGKTHSNHSLLWQIKPGNYRLAAVCYEDTSLHSQIGFMVK